MSTDRGHGHAFDDVTYELPGQSGPWAGIPKRPLMTLRNLERAKRFELSTPTLARVSRSPDGVRPI